MTPPERDHPSLRETPNGAPIWMRERNYWEDQTGGWANDPRSLRRRAAETVADNLLRFAAVAVTLIVISAVFGD